MSIEESTVSLVSQFIQSSVIVFFFLPESEVLLQEFDDGLGITEIVLLEFIDLLESVLKSDVSKLASSLVILHDFVVENREVKGKSKLDWVAGWQLNAISLPVGFQSILLDFLKESILGILRDVAVVVSNHLHEEGFWLSRDIWLFEHL